MARLAMLFKLDLRRYPIRSDTMAICALHLYRTTVCPRQIRSQVLLMVQLDCSSVLPMFGHDTVFRMVFNERSNSGGKTKCTRSGLPQIGVALPALAVRHRFGTRLAVFMFLMTTRARRLCPNASKE